MSRAKNLMLIGAVILLSALPLWIVQRPAPGADGQPTEIFAGSDDKAKNLIGEIRPDYKPWFEPIFEPASQEIASLLFALQAALGAGFIGFYLGVAVTREKHRREIEAKERRETESGAG